MTKSKKERRVKQPPFVVYFKPQGVPIFALQQVILNVDEYEAIRLADWEGLKHDESSQKMKISRPTFTRLLNSAHKKISDAMVNGKSIRIEGGNFVLLKKRFYCKTCNNVWSISQNGEHPDNCPQCNNNNITNLNSQFGNERGYGKGKRGWMRGHNN